jgi:hypothetical protein
MLTVLLKVLANLAVLFASQGQGDRAVTLLELVHRHPASEQEIKAKANCLLDELGFVPADGKIASLDVVVAETLSELSPVTTDRRDTLEVSNAY